RFEASDGLTRIIDRIEYELPFGILGKIAAWLGEALIMKVTFASRRAATRRALETATSMQDAAGAAV
ncbi:MAG: hypothetical protein RMN25_14485, partial [Anaerolineae bacterium]|nr:hypothetical protein [Thermoflexales bacterium]MDW8408978.1 hypothetical protein [Anaerolineae bacterium]